MPAASSGAMTDASPSMSATAAGAPTALRSAATTVNGCESPSRSIAVSFLATTSGVSGEDVRDLMLAAVEHRFGPVNRLPLTIEWLSDNGSCYLAGETRSFARDIGLEPRTTPIESPQSNGMAEAFVHTIKRDYVRVSPCPDADTVMHQLSAGSLTTTRFTRTRHSDIVHPVSSSQLTETRDRVRSFGGYNNRYGRYPP